MRALTARVNGLLPKGILDAGCQFLLFFLAYQGYQVVRGLADRHGRRLRPTRAR